MGLARCVGASSSANNVTPPGTGVNRAVGDLMATQIHTCSSSVIVIVRYCCVSLKVVEVAVAKPTVKSGDVSPVEQGSVDDASEEPLHPR